MDLGSSGVPRLLVVSNRQPTLDSEAGAGGLAVALKAVLQEAGGLWLGWSGGTAPAPGSEPRRSRRDGIELLSLDLTEREREGYYCELANRSLWPLFHGRVDLARFEHDAYAVYRGVNARFAETLAPRLREGDMIWVHDYHLIPLARELRRRGVTAPIGFFLHIPFPQGDLLERLPWLAQLLADFCGYDLVGFQTRGCRQNFLDVMTRATGARADGARGIRHGGREVRTGVFPISIDTAAVRRLATSPRVRWREARLRRQMSPQDWIIGVERLDYSKGLPERFLALERLLETRSAMRGRVSLLQIAAPSREGIAEYAALQERLATLAGRINGRFGTEEWQPIRYITRCYDQSRLAALYRRCRIGLVTPLCDGMNLVAKEYVAAQDARAPGTLILSRFAGAARELTDALLVNPGDLDEVAAAIGRAVDMPLDERRRRWSGMVQRLETHDVHRWARSYVAALETAARERGTAFPGEVSA